MWKIHHREKQRQTDKEEEGWGGGRRGRDD